MANNGQAKTILKEASAEMNMNGSAAEQGTNDYLNSYFIRLRNQEQLFRLGKDLADGLKVGIKNIAFTSSGLKSKQQNTILGICCFFYRAEHLKIAIISDQLKHGVFQDLVGKSAEASHRLESAAYAVRYSSYFQHFDFVDYAELQRFYEMHFYNEVFDKELEKFFSRYDLVLWDIPEVETMKSNPHFHYRLSKYYQSLTAIVSSSSSTKQIKDLKDYFSSYKLNVSRILFDTGVENKKVKTKKFLGIF